MKEVIILGHGPTRIQCDYHCETWGVNNTYTFAKRLDKLFIVDKITDKEFDFPALSQVSCIVSSMPYPNHPEWKIELYPLREVLNYFKTNFFSNAICYMIAYALYNRYEKIYFYGIDMMTSTSYLFEKGGVEYWMGVSHALGVPIINTKESATGKTIDGKMYGCWDGIDGSLQYSKAVAEEVARLTSNLTSKPSVELDPDGHLARKSQLIQEAIKDGLKLGDLKGTTPKLETTKSTLDEFALEIAGEQRRDVVRSLGFKDESEEWVKVGENWVRKEVRIVPSK